MNETSNSDTANDTSTDTYGDRDNTTTPLGIHERPTVPVFYNLPADAVDRAIERFKRRRENVASPQRQIDLREYIYDEIDEKPMFFVDGEPLAEYAGGRVDELTIEPGEEE